MTDRLKEIKRRHQLGISEHEDVDWLLAEVERSRMALEIFSKLLKHEDLDAKQASYQLEVWSCSDCPFGKLDEDKFTQMDYWFNSEKAHYQCSLRNERVFSRNPPCTLTDWFKRLNIDAPTGEMTMFKEWLGGQER